MKIKHKKKRHAAYPLWQNLRMLKTYRLHPIYESMTFKWQLKFDKSCKYRMDGEDAYDFSKALGLSFPPILKGNKNSVMLGWRYNKDIDSLQVIPYFNKPNGDYHFDLHHIINVKPDEIINISIKLNISLNSVAVYINGVGHIYRDLIDIKSNDSIRRINSWFGGNKKAPHKMHYYKDFIGYEYEAYPVESTILSF